MTKLAKRIERLRRIAIAGACFALAAILLWRGYAHPNAEPFDNSALGPVMCSITALSLAINGLVIGFGVREEM